MDHGSSTAAASTGSYSLAASSITAPAGINNNGAGSHGVRPFRSRKHRPCDLCRKRRSRCAIPEQGSACIECLQTGKACTFLDQPVDRKEQAKKRQRSAQNASPPAAQVQAQPFATAIPPPVSGPSSSAQAAQTSPLHLVAESTDNMPLEVSLEAIAALDGFEPTAITSLLTDDLLPVSAGAKDAAQGAVTSHFQISSDASKPTFFVLPDIPDCT